MDIEKLIAAVKLCGSTPRVDQCKNCTYWAAGDMSKCIPRMTIDAATALSMLQKENEKLRAELEQVKRCIEIVEKQRDSAIEELENYMVQDVLDGNEPCEICAKASDTPCECCDPKWRGPKED